MSGEYDEIKKKIVSIIKNIKSKNLYSYDEATVKQTVVLNILSALNWNIFDENEVKPEFSVKGLSVDYALSTLGKSKVFIEVKRAEEPLERHQDQLLNYSFLQGVKLAVLTNGISWWFYLPLEEGSWTERKFDEVNLETDNAEAVANKFLTYLLKENVRSNKAVEVAREKHQEYIRQKVIENALITAWKEVINERNYAFVELLANTTENICGFPVARDLVVEFIEKRKSQVSNFHKSIYQTTKIAEHTKTQKRARKIITPRSILGRYLLEVLVELGGAGTKKEVTERVYDKIKGMLTSDDLETLKSGEVRWKKNLYWQRYIYVQEGILKKDSPRGLWEISDKGREYYHKLGNSSFRAPQGSKQSRKISSIWEKKNLKEPPFK